MNFRRQAGQKENAHNGAEVWFPRCNRHTRSTEPGGEMETGGSIQ